VNGTSLWLNSRQFSSALNTLMWRTTQTATMIVFRYVNVLAGMVERVMGRIGMGMRVVFGNGG